MTGILHRVETEELPRIYDHAEMGRSVLRPYMFWVASGDLSYNPGV
jgi:hypothetical protein